MIRLLVHSRDPRLHPVLSASLHPEFEVRVEADAARVKEMAFSKQADVLILDFDSDYSDLKEHLALFDTIQSFHVPIVVMSDDKTRSTALELMQRSACDCIRKPPSLVELRIILRRAYDHANLKRELSTMRGIARSEPACDQLIGAGARAIHNLSRRSAAPFVAVSCGAIPETLLEAELFGHEKGAYTGTIGSREGYFEQAGKGTLFLDEIGELSLHAQVKLLRVLQQREFSKLGSSRLIPMKARVLFATHRNLAQMVDEGKFRSDLYFRVNVMQIKVPALRQRPEEIPLLANHFLEKYASEYGKAVDHIHSSALSRLMEYDWPGNIRELENAIARGVIVTQGRCIVPQDLPESLRLEEDVVCIEQPIAAMNSFEDQMREYKIKLANRAILECNGNKTLAARSLQISRAYLHRLLRGGVDDGGRGAPDEFNIA
jgi:DNA-binding NtrC family response regulator